jgi:hypothetical protein
VKIKSPISTAIAIALGIVVLLGYFFTQPVLLDIRLVLVQWAVVLAGFAVVAGVISLLAVHIDKIRKKQKGSIYSLLVVFALPLTFLLGLFLRPDDPKMVLLFQSVQFPVEASLMALLTVSLVYASIRLLRRRLNLLSVVFLVTALLTLLGMATLPLIGDVPLLGDWIRPFIAQVLAGAGARGILIGVALGTLLTGLRVLIGADRPYGGK